MTDTSYDTIIDNLISELSPVIEYAIEPGYFSSDAGIIATINLGATEIVCGEFLTQQARELGATEGMTWNGLEIFGRKTGDDAANLKAQGAARLNPYLRLPVSVIAVSAKVTS